MKKLLLLLAILPSFALSEGPYFKSTEPAVQQEFENVYKDIRSKRITVDASGNICIDAPTFCVDPAGHIVRIGTNTVIFASGATSLSGNVVSSGSYIGGAATIESRNTSNTSGSDATIRIVVGGSSAGDPAVRYTINGVTDWIHGVDNSAGDSWVLSNNSSLGTNNYLVVTTNGEITKPLQPSFLVTAPSNPANVTGDGTSVSVEYDTEVFDQGNDFDPTTFTFTAPVDGRYLLSAHCETVGNTTAQNVGVFTLITSNRQYKSYEAQVFVVGSNGVWDPKTITVIADMDAGDSARCTIEVDGVGKIVEVENSAQFSYFSGSLIN